MLHDTHRPALILHADDFGMNAAVNQGIIRGFAEGLLTSTSLLTNAPDARTALAQWKLLDRERSRGAIESTGARHMLGDRLTPFDLGLHLNLTQGRPLTANYPAQLLDDAGRFPGIVRLFRTLGTGGKRFREPVEAELRAQWQWMIDAGFPPTHVNGHQYVELIPVVAGLLPSLCDEFQTPVVRCARESGLRETLLQPKKRWSTWLVGRVKRYFADRLHKQLAGTALARPEAFFGTCHAGEVRLGVFESFFNIARRDRSLSVEVGVHPGDEAHQLPEQELADGWLDPLAKGRVEELRVLRSDRLLHLVEHAGFRLARLRQFTSNAERRGDAA